MNIGCIDMFHCCQISMSWNLSNRCVEQRLAIDLRQYLLIMVQAIQQSLQYEHQKTPTLDPSIVNEIVVKSIKNINILKKK